MMPIVKYRLNGHPDYLNNPVGNECTFKILAEMWSTVPKVVIITLAPGDDSIKLSWLQVEHLFIDPVLKSISNFKFRTN
jgi:hypothetical protein